MFRATRPLRHNMAFKPINLILDWDGTITVKDTMFAYGKIADTRDARLNREANGSESFERFGKAWMEDYSAHEEAYYPKPSQREEVAQESAWLKSLSHVEARSVERVESTKFFAGVTHSDISATAKDLLDSGSISLRTGWDKLFLRTQEGETAPNPLITLLNVSILSVNWSEAFIRASLKAATKASFPDDRLHDHLDRLKIAANEISGIHLPDGSSGRLTDPNHTVIRTSFDKLQHFSTRPRCRNLYVGDSTTDFDCLLTADLGICIRDDPMGSSAKTLAETLSRVGYTVAHVDEVDTWHQLSNSRSNLLWARDFDEILSLLDRVQGSDEDTH
jgi:hypothetical protein